MDMGTRSCLLTAPLAMAYRFESDVLCGSTKSNPEPAGLRWSADHAAELKRNERKRPLMDGLLAASALQHQLGIVSRDPSVFPDGEAMLNLWTG